MQFLNKIFGNIFLFLVIFSIGYQDFPLRNYIGEIGLSPIILLSPFMLIGNILNNKRDIVEYKFFLFASIPILVSSYAYMFLIFTYPDYINMDTIVKSIKLLSYFVVLYIVFRFLMRQNLQTILRYTFYITILYNIIFIFEFMNIPNAFLFLHSSNDDYWRIRLLTSEASWAGLIYIIYASISFFYLLNNKKVNGKFFFILFFVFSLIFLGMLESKGVYILYPVSFLIVILTSKMKLLKKYIIAIAVLLATIGIIPLLLESVVSDLENFTSIAVRASSFVVGIIMFFTNPFGYGLGTYHIFFLELANKYISMIGNYIDIPGINMVITLINNDVDAYTIKSGILKYFVLTGILGVIIIFNIFYYYKKILKEIDFIRGVIFLKIAFYFMIFSIIFYQDILVKYEVILLLVVIYKINKERFKYVYIHRS